MLEYNKILDYWTPEKLEELVKHPEQILDGEDAVKRINRIHEEGWANIPLKI